MIRSIKQKKGYKLSFWEEVKRYKQLYIMLIPFFFFFFLLTIVPILSSVFLSFTYFNMLEFPEWRGLLNFSRLLLDDDVFLIAIRNTLIFAFITGPVSYLMCFGFAWLINELGPKLRAFVTLVFYAPSISVNVFFIWQFLFSGDSYGFINGRLLQWGLINEPILWLHDPDYNLKIIILVQLWISLGASFLAFIAGLQGVDRNLYDAGAVDGIKNRWQELWYITLPSMKPQLLFGAVIQIATMFSVGTIAMNLAGFPSTNYSARTIVTHMYDYGTVRFELGYASSIAVLLFALMYLTKLTINKLLNYIGR